VLTCCQVMLWGDPNNGDAVGSIPASKVTSICHDGDNICDGKFPGIIVTDAHTNYQEDVVTSASTIAKALA
jgi:cutinase